MLKPKQKKELILGRMDGTEKHIQRGNWSVQHSWKGLAGTSLHLEVKFPSHMVILYLAFQGIIKLFPIETTPFHIPTNYVQRFQLLYIPTNTCCFPFFYYVNPSKCEMVPCSDFGAQENKSVAISIFSSSLSHEVMGLDAMILVF